MALSFSFLNKKKEENPLTAGIQSAASVYQTPKPQQSTVPQQSKVPQSTSATYQGKILGSGLTSNYAANPSNTGPSSPGYKAPQPAPQAQPRPQPQVPQMQASGYESALQNYLNQSANSADYRAQLASERPEAIAQQQQRLIDLANKQAQQQAETAQQRYDIFKQNRLADVADLEKSAELSRSQIQTNRDEAIRAAAENNRSSMNQLQSLFAGLGTLDSGAFQRMTAGQQAKFAGGQQGLYKAAEQDLNDIEVNLNSARREAQGLIQSEELNLQDKLAQIDATVQKGTIEYQNAVENAIYESQDKIAGIYDELAGIENAANLKYLDYMEKIGQSGNQNYETETALRTELFNRAKENKIYDVQNAYSKILSAPETAAGDISLIFNYMKMLDPGSVVREGEFATAQNAAGIPQQVQNMYNKALSGQRLAPAQRQDFKQTAGSVYESAVGNFQNELDFYSQLAQQQGLNPQNVIGQFNLGQGQGVSSPQGNPAIAGLQSFVVK